MADIRTTTLEMLHDLQVILEKIGFKYEGVAQSYLNISGRWRAHIIYSLLRDDRRGRNEP